jgi:2-C-methyl-D-erythritol 4-phosphate cytidylyltransferase
VLRVGVCIPAAGSGQRMGGLKKPYLELAGEPILRHALRPFLARADVVAVVVALAPEDSEAPPPWLGSLDPRVSLVAGGATRAQSVHIALAALPSSLDVIVVHDAARPLLTADLLEGCIRIAAQGKGAVAGVPAIDTLKQVDGEGRVTGTPERSRFWHAQTPQAFPAELIRKAYAALREGDAATDDAALVERVGGVVVMVESSPRNFKVTRPEDLALAEHYLTQQSSEDVAEPGRRSERQRSTHRGRAGESSPGGKRIAP